VMDEALPSSAMARRLTPWFGLFLASALMGPALIEATSLFEGAGLVNLRGIALFALLSLVLSTLAFVTGPLTLAGCLYLVGSLTVVGLSDDHRYFLCCSSKNRAEAGLLALAPVFAAPAAVLSTYLLTIKLRGRTAVLSHAFGLTLLVAVAGQISLWAFDRMERNVQCSAVRCNGF